MSSAPANWYPDPTGRHQYRYYDGTAWTEHVSDDGVTALDPLTTAASPTRLDRVEQMLVVGDEADPAHVQAQVRQSGYRGAGIAQPIPGGGGTIFDEPILVVNQKVKIIELNNQYQVFDQYGRRLATVQQVGQTTAKKVLRLMSSLDQFMTHKLQVLAPSGQPLLQLTRPAKVFKSTILVSDGQEREIGRIVQENVIGKISFALESGGQRVGAIKGENWRAWNFRIEDAGGAEVARITKTFEGFLRTAFTTADNYVVKIHARQPEPLHSLVVASALSVDTALKQDARGFG
jgi:hypothetical protein